MNFLPNLEIEEDIKNLGLDDDTLDLLDPEEFKNETLPEENVTVISQEKIKQEDIFINKPTSTRKKKSKEEELIDTENIEDEIIDTVTKEEIKPKKKKIISEKQKLHLEKIRSKAQIAKKEKAELRKQKLLEAKQEFKTIQKIKKLKPVVPKITTSKITITEEQNQEKMEFLSFMANMNKFEEMKFMYQKEHKPIEKTKKKIIENSELAPGFTCHIPIEKKQIKNPLIVPQINDPYNDWF
tara:strand:+ start:34 stop:753 length:720 start_codon:yes stop_codon:yes gene_type:complete